MQDGAAPDVLLVVVEVPHTDVPISNMVQFTGSALQSDKLLVMQQNGGPEVPHIIHSSELQLGNSPLVH